MELAIDAARKVNPKLHVCCISPDIPIYPYFEEGHNVKARAARVDQILITGDPSIVDFEQYVDGDEARQSVAGKSQYVGFMDKPREPGLVPHRSHNDIVVYLGGNANDLQNKYVSLLANIPHMNDDLRHAHWHIIMPAIENMTAGARVATMLESLPKDIQKNISLEAVVPDAEFTAKLRRTDMVIVGGGQTATKTALIEGCLPSSCQAIWASSMRAQSISQRSCQIVWRAWRSRSHASKHTRAQRFICHQLLWL